MRRLLWPLLAIAVLATGCQDQEKHTEGDGHEGESAQGQEESGHVEGEVKLDAEQAKVAGIEVESASLRTLRLSLDVPGTVNSTAKGRAVVTPPVGGRVVAVKVGLGDRVQQGQGLAVLESAELAQSWSSIAAAEQSRDSASAALREARSELALAIAKVSAARSSLSRQRQLASAGAFSQAPLQAAQSEMNDAQSELLSAQSERASHAEAARRIENLYRDGIASKVELEAARLEALQDQIRYDRAVARVAAARTALEREKTIASRGLLNAKEIQTAEAEVKASQLEADRARIRVTSSEASLANAHRAVANARSVYRSASEGSRAAVGRMDLKAPISGTVTHVDVTKGQAVDRTQVLMEIENLSSVWVTANVPERDAAKVRKGASVRVTASAIQGQAFNGVVQIVGERVDPKTRTVPVQCIVSGVSGVLKPEMFTTVHLEYGQGETALAVPKSAILSDRENTYVFVKDDHGYRKVMVQLGSRSGAYIGIKSGLEVGDLVVVKGGFVLDSELKKDELKGHEH